MGKVTATALAAVCAFVPSTAYAQVPTGAGAVGFSLAGFLAVAAILAAAFFIAKQQFPEGGPWRFIVIAVVFFYFVGFGGMDWFTFGEWQGMPWETFDGQTQRYNPGSGWVRN